MNKQQTINCLTVIATFFPHGFTLADPAMVTVWHKALEPYEAGEVEAAVWDLCRMADSNFPTLRDVIRRLEAASSVGVAWGELRGYLAEWANGTKYVGGQALQPPGLPPDIEAAVKSLGGVDVVRVCPAEREGALRSQFLKELATLRMDPKVAQAVAAFRLEEKRRVLAAPAVLALAAPVADPSIRQGGDEAPAVEAPKTREERVAFFREQAARLGRAM